ncbi:transglutaminase-like cysteine peptidase [Sulfurimonas sp.]
MKFLLRVVLILTIFSSYCMASELITKKLEKRAEKKYGRFAKNRFIDIDTTLLKKLKNSSDIKKLNFVNTWVNFIKYKSDKQIYGVNDYWATLYEFVGKNSGDCEDYTIAKYYILKALGIDPHRMKFAYVIYKSRSGKKSSHMVLAYLKTSKPKTKKDILILGNNNRLVLPASKRPDLIKVIKMINGDTGPKSKKWKKLEAGMKRKKL